MSRYYEALVLVAVAVLMGCGGGVVSAPNNSPPSVPSPHSVALSWSPSPSSVIGYNVYRGTAPGGPYSTKLTSSPQLTTSLTDSTVMGGTTYYYVATSVDPSSVESIYSNQFIITIP